MISHKMRGETYFLSSPHFWSASFMVGTTTVSDHLRSPNFRSWLMKTRLINAFADVRLPIIQEFHLWQLNTKIPNCFF